MTKDENGILKQMCAPCVQGEMAALGMPKLVLVLVVEKKNHRSTKEESLANI